jgi:hypothetical protein
VAAGRDLRFSAAHSRRPARRNYQDVVHEITAGYFPRRSFPRQAVTHSFHGGLAGSSTAFGVGNQEPDVFRAKYGVLHFVSCTIFHTGFLCRWPPGS